MDNEAQSVTMSFNKAFSMLDRLRRLLGSTS
jgi:hypothetical protein